jgi:hypothetical protein
MSLRFDFMSLPRLLSVNRVGLVKMSFGWYVAPAGVSSALFTSKFYNYMAYRRQKE